METDASARQNLDQHILQYSLRATSDALSDISTLKKLYRTPEAPKLIQLIAVSGASSPCSDTAGTSKPIVSTRNRWREIFCGSRRSKPEEEKPALPINVYEAKDYIVEEEEVTESKGSVTNSALYQGLLGIVLILPFMEGGRRAMSCYARTCTLVVLSAEESVLGTKLWHAVNSALIDEAMSRCREREKGFKQMIVATPFHECQPTLVSFRNVLLEKGFEQVGLHKEVLEKKGILLDRIHLQREL